MTLSLSKVYNPQPGWYRGDFHAHTHFSDGYFDPPQLAEVAKAEGLDFFAITDHNTIDSFPYFGDDPGLLVIPGIEVTFQEGHFNVFGIEGQREWVDPLLAERSWRDVKLGGRYQTTTEVMQAASAQGLLNSINHPLLKPWEWRDGATELSHLTCLEVWNDPSWPDNKRDNPRAVALWTELLDAGYRITAIGGSDYHRPVPPLNPPKPPDRLGLPSTYVYAGELSGRAILQALRQRRAYVSMGPTVTFRAHLNGATHDIGADLGPVSGEIRFEASVSGCASPATARIVRRYGEAVAEMEVVDGSASLAPSQRVDVDTPAWYRFDVLDREGMMLAITNPIFAGPARTPDRNTFGDFVSLE
ncbi:MAG: CehA/McbA family metallohydrolase [Anaerolineales bacterium]